MTGRSGVLPFSQSAARYGYSHPIELGDGGSHRLLHDTLIEVLLADQLAIQIQIRVKVGRDQFFTDSELCLQRLDRRCPVKAFRVDIVGFEPQFAQVARRFGRAMIG